MKRAETSRSQANRKDWGGNFMVCALLHPVHDTRNGVVRGFPLL